MSIYIYKNNQQTGPFEESKVLEMLGGGQLSPNDMGIRSGESQWQPLANLFPRVILSTPQATSPMANGVTNNGCRRIFGIGLLILGFFLFIGGSFFPVKNALRSNGGQNLACQNAGKAKQKADESFREYEKSKGTNAEAKIAEELKQNIGIVRMWSETCSELNSSHRRWMIILTILGGFGFILTIAGFFISRVRKLA